MFTQEELKNLSVLIARANITGAEAMAVAVLQQKIGGLMEPEATKEETPEDK